MFDFLHTMKGPDFLGLYVAWFLATFIGVWIARCCGRDTMLTSALGLLIFEGLGVARGHRPMKNSAAPMPRDFASTCA